MKKTILLLILLAGTGILPAQNISISGSILSAKDQSPVAFANIIAEGARSGASSDLDGRFELQIPANTKNLIVSCMGFATDTIAFHGQANLKIELIPSMQQLDEFVVTALGISRKKKALGFSVQEVKGDDIQTARDPNMINSLSGKVAGLQISSTTGGPASSSRIVLRGNSSFNNNQALIVVDGVPINNETNNTTNEWGGFDYGSGISDINPDDVESISVLKGASASALYGSRAQNGVIIITTKKGKKSKDLGIRFSSNTEFTQAYIPIEFQNEYGAGRNGKFEAPWKINDEGIPVYQTESPSAYGSWGPRMEGQTIIDWDGQKKTFDPQPNNYRDYFNTGLNTTNNISLEGGSDRMTYRFSYTNLYNKDIVPETKLNRHNFNLHTVASISKAIKLDFSTSYMYQKANNRLGLSNSFSVPRNYIFMPRHISDASLEDHMMNENGYEQTWYTNWNWQTNPYWMHTYELNDDVRNRIVGNVKLDIQLMEKLKFMLRANADIGIHRFNNRQAFKGISNSLGSYNQRWLHNFQYNTDFLFSWDDKINPDWEYNLNFGGNILQYKNEDEAAWTDGGLSVPNFYNVNYSNNPTRNNYYLREKRINSVYGFGQLAYKGWMYLDLTARNDWSSTLPSANNSYFYPSVSAGFIFTDAFDFAPEWLPFGKLRASWAQVGGDTDPYQLQYTFNQLGSYNGVPYSAITSFIPNLNLQPEITTSQEIGANLHFLSHNLILDVTYYNQTTKNQILAANVSPASGSLMAMINSGKINNKGVELELTAKILNNPTGFSWNTSLNLAKNSSEVLELADDLPAYTLRTHWRLSIEARPGHPYGDIVGYAIKRDADGNKLINSQTGLYVRDDQPSVLGNYMPDLTGGFRNSLSYKDISLSFLIDFRIGGDMYSGTNMYMSGYSGNLESTLEGREEWYASEAAREAAGVSPNDWTATGGYLAEGVFANGETNNIYVNPEEYWGQFTDWGNEIHEPFIYDATYFKLRELVLTWNIPDNALRKLRISNASVSLVGRNLWLIYSGVPNVDPESSYTNGNGQGFEIYSYPMRRSFGINLKFNI